MKPSTENPSGSGSVSRRRFISSTAKSAAFLSAASSVLVSRNNVLGANERIGVGFIGVGGRGSYHVGVVKKWIDAGESLQIVAVNDAYGPRLRAAAEKTKAKAYPHHKALLADRDVDVVCIASPDRLHVPQALDAIRAGKDVYCEKPMGHWTQFKASKEFFQETRRLSRVVQIGNQGNSSNAWKKIGDLVKQGAIGRVQHIQAGYYRCGDWGERMPIPDPNAKPGPDLDWEAFLGDAPKVAYDVRRFFSWRMFLDYAGGPCTDLFPHVFTPFVSIFGLKFPSQVVASGGIYKYDDYGREVPDTFNMCLDYPERLSIVLVCTLTNQFNSAPAIRGDEGAITIENTAWEGGFDSVTVHPRKGTPKVIPGEKPDSTLAHWKNFLECVRTRQKPVSDVEFGYHVQTALCMAMLAYLKKSVAQFDRAKEDIVL